MTAIDRRRFHKTLLAVPAAALLGTGLGSLAPAAASAAPADWNAHLLAGMANGGLMHRTRLGSGTWDPSWSGLDTDGTLYYVAASGVSTDLHVVASINGQAPRHRFRSAADGTWTPFETIPSTGGTTGLAQVAATSLDGRLHVFTAANGAVRHTSRGADGTWDAAWVRLRTFASVTHLAATRVGSTLHVAAVVDGAIFLNIRAADGTWGSWANVETGAGQIGDVSRVALAGTGAQLQVVARSAGYALYHAIRKGDGTWQKFAKPSALSGLQPIAISAANVGGEMQLGMIDLTDAGQVVKHTIRRTDGTWQKVGTVSSAGMSAQPGELALAGTPIA
ncbi:hypothetical protein GCM10009853_032790 [Glycomyces scopariae]|uniref:Tat (Twin-arginine translocation) pathway signal sequence n=1 Tax=Glycomyces sambucus TaxID=380244 RepID=A0A1G9CSA3_9ACTN|nr:hypothetical protein [Glycomyces sambucus]SDK54335.1 hypothetical protein SAMN05216298_0478 [Glycomyces sambucus]